MMRFLFTAVIIGLIGCKKTAIEPDSILESEQEPKQELILQHPQHEYAGRLDSVTFEWTSTEMGMKHLILSAHNDFSEVLLDTIVAENTFTVVDLQPGKDYFWKIKTENLAAATSFNTIDPLLDLSSQYEVETLQISFESSPSRVDTTLFVETINLIKEDKGIRIQHGKGYINRLCEYSKYSEGKYIYSFPYSASNGSSLYLDRMNQVVEVSSRIGGIGSGTIYTARFNY